MNHRGRIAPSPTGLLHLGHAATFWTAYQRAIAASGTLVLRMEDLDPQRSKAEFAEAAIEDLQLARYSLAGRPGCGRPIRSLRPKRTACDLPGSAGQADRAQVWSTPAAARAKTSRSWRRLRMRTSRCTPELAGRESSSTSSGAVETSIQIGVNWRFRVPDGEAY